MGVMAATSSTGSRTGPDIPEDPATDEVAISKRSCLFVSGFLGFLVRELFSSQSNAGA